LRRRITLAFLATTAFTCLLFGFFAFMFAYLVEDQLFTDALADEAVRQQAHWRSRGSFAEPRDDFVTLYRDPSGFPPDLRERYADEGGSEIAGRDGRHYHLRRFDLPGGGPAFAVAEVSRHLVVRPLREELLIFLAVFAAALLLATGFAAYLLARRATAPLTALANQVAETETGFVPSIAVPDSPPREIALLAQALEQAFDRLRAFVAREARFTRDSSHELRTPLAVIRGAAELIALQPGLGPEVAGPLRRIRAAVREMEQTIELLLVLAREEHGRSSRDILPILPFVEQAVLNASERFEGGATRVEIDVPATQTVEAAPAVLALILNNLVANAFQHARGKPVLIVGDGLGLAIADGGPGIPPELAVRMFEPFAKGEGSAGHGLGLSIVKRLCEREGISLSVRSEPAAGTRIVLRFEGWAEAAGEMS
jgi:signal transduction histidine kinase